MSRLTNTIRNTVVGFAAQLIVILLNYINRTIFIYYLGAEYLGLSGLFSNILSMLSLAELGIGVAISFSLYKPLEENDIRKTKALMNFYQLAYRIIGIVILILGLCLIPFLDVLIKDKPDIPHFTLIYVLFLSNTVVSYFFTYKRSLLSADQKEYLNSVTLGLFWNDRFKPWIESAINLISSIILIRYYGFMGVLLGTLISTVTTSLWVEPYMLYKHGFKQSVWDYFGRYAQYMICIIACTVLSALVTRFIQVDSFVMWTIKAVLVATVSTGIVCVLYRSTEEFKWVERIMSGVVKKIFQR